MYATCAVDGTGVTEVIAGLSRHGAWCEGAGRGEWENRRADGRVRDWLDLVADNARDGALARIAGTTLLADLRAGRIRPLDLERQT